MEVLLHPSYFPNITQMAIIVQSQKIIFEKEDNYQKQTYRNRTHIAHSNGKLALHIPIKHSKNGERQKTKEVIIENSFKWQQQHWRSIQTAYRSAPYFEYYEDDFNLLFTNKVNYLWEFNLQIFNILVNIIEIDTPYSFTNKFDKQTPYIDARFLIDAKKEPLYQFSHYNQVLQTEGSFISNLSILDLIFNIGPETYQYLSQIPMHKIIPNLK